MFHSCPETFKPLRKAEGKRVQPPRVEMSLGGSIACVQKWDEKGSSSACRMFEAALYTLPRIWDELLKDCGYYKRCDDIKAFNQEHAWRKRGISITPCR